MSANKTPDYKTGRRGRNWTYSLVMAQKAGAVIVVEETGEPVKYDRRLSGPGRFRPWRRIKGRIRFDSRECIPEW